MADLKFKGLPATVVVELEGRHGTIRVPITEFANYRDIGGGYGELRIAIGQPLIERLYLADLETKKVLGP